ncbi:MAG: NAD(P)-binding domain-containing protein, partial [Firmicutes bacterium]|nr:NAD(P)-binding domain-containing protein [Bacillota bacterium]
MAKVYYERDAHPELIRSKRVAVLGYGSQGHAHALNLRDQGVSVVVGLKPGGSWDRARADGFRVVEVAEAVREADVVSVLLPDMVQAQVYRESIRPHLRRGQA